MKAQYLKEGEQTKITPIVRETAGKINRYDMEMPPEVSQLSKNFQAAYKTAVYINRNIPLIKSFKELLPSDLEAEKKLKTEENERLKFKVGRKRTVSQILEEGYFPTCSDIGILFRGLMIAQEVPTSYVETFHKDYILGNNPNSMHTHSFGRVFDDDNPQISILVDPTNIENYNSEQELFSETGYVIVAEGFDIWNTDIRDYDDIIRIKILNNDALFEKYKKLSGKS